MIGTYEHLMGSKALYDAADVSKHHKASHHFSIKPTNKFDKVERMQKYFCF